MKTKEVKSFMIFLKRRRYVKRTRHLRDFKELKNVFGTDQDDNICENFTLLEF